MAKGRKSTMKRMPTWNKATKAWEGDNSDTFWKDLADGQRLDRTEIKQLKRAMIFQDSGLVSSLAMKGGFVVDIPLPTRGVDGVETYKDYFERIFLFDKGMDTIDTRAGMNLQRGGGAIDARVQTQAATEKMGRAFVRTIEKSAEGKVLMDQVTGLRAEHIHDFIGFMRGEVNLKTLPQVLVGMRQMIFELRTGFMQRALMMETGMADDLAIAEFQQFAEILAKVTDAFAGNASKVGQSLNALQITPGSRKGQDWYFNMKDSLKDMSNMDKKDLTKLATKVTQAGDDATAGRLAQEFKKNKKWARSLSEFFTNSILSGPPTLAINTLSGAFQTLYVPMERMAGAAIRLDLAGVRSEFAAFRGLAESMRLMIRMTGRSIEFPEKELGFVNPGRNALQTLKTSHPVLDSRTMLDEAAYAIDSGNYGLQDGTWGASIVNAFGNTVRLPGRAMMTVDEMAKGVNYNMKLMKDGHDWATAQVKANPELDLDTVARNYAKETTNWRHLKPGSQEQMLARTRYDQALDYARRATFQEDLNADSFAKSLQSFTSKHPTMRLVMPFVRTPANILKFAAQRTPLLHKLSKEHQAALAKGGAEAQAVRDRLTVASAVWTSTMLLAASGNITGGGPRDRQERANWEATGWEPYSIYTGLDEDGKPTWVSFRRADPFGLFFSVAADLSEAFSNIDTESPEAAELVGGAFYALANNIKSRSYFTGITQALNAFENPERLAPRYFNNMMSNLVPNLFSTVRRYGPIGNDDAMREVDGLRQTLQNRIPGLSYGLAPRKNIYGDIQKYPQGVGPSIVNPFYEAKNGLTPEILTQLKQGTFNLKDTAPENRPSYAAVMLNYQFNMDNFDHVDGVELDPFQRDQWISLAGPEIKRNLQKLVSMAGWDQLSDPVPGDENKSQKYRAFAGVVRRQRAIAKSQLIRNDKSLQQKLREARLEEQRLRNYRPDNVLGNL